VSTPASERLRTLLLRTDNQLKGGRPEAARETLAEAGELAADPRVPAELRELVRRRIAALGALRGD
jgi:hypothetical protein